MLSKYSVKKPFTVVVAIIIVLILGVVSYTSMSIDLLPNMNMPYVIVVTTYPGTAAEEVEDKLTIPVETSMASVTDVENITSTSSDNYSMVAIEFNQSADMDSAIVEINSLLDQLQGNLPEGAGSPLSMKINPSMIPTMIFAVSLEGQDRQAISNLVDTKLASEFESLGGVASVSATGLLENMINVTISDSKITALQKTLDENIQKTIDAAVAEGNEKFTNMQNEVISLSEKAYKKQAEAEEAKAAITTVTLNVLMNQVKEGLTAKMQAYAAEIQKVLEDYKKGVNEQIQQKIDQISGDISEKLPSVTPGGEVVPDITLPEGVTQEELEEQLKQLQAQLDSLTEIISGIQSQEDLEKVMAQLEETLKNAISSQLPQIPKLDLDAMMAEVMTEAQASVSKSDEVKKAAEKYAGLYADYIAKSEAASTAKTNLQIAAAMAASQSDSADTSAMGNISTNISKTAITSLLTAQNFDMPAGNLTEGGDDFVIRTGNKIESYEELCNLPLMNVPTIGVIKLSDIAEITKLDNSSQMYARVNGENGVMLSVSKEPQYSTADVSNILYDKMDELKKDYEGISFTVLSDQGQYVNLMVGTIIENLVIGGLLAIFVLLIFLKSIKPTFIVGISIVICVITSFVLMYFSGISLNVISMCGLALSVGMLVDNSIVVVENIFRLKAEGVPVRQAAIDGAKQMAGAVTASTITTVVVFVPIIFTDGLTRQLFTDMALTITFALLSSLLVALTLVPMASAGMLKNTVIKPNKTFDKIAGGYGKLLGKTLQHRWICIVLVVVLLAGSIWAAFSSGTELFPQTDSGNISISVELPADATAEEKAAALDQLYDSVKNVESVETVGILNGTSNGVMSLMGGGGTTCYVLLEEDRELSTEQVAQKLKEATADLNFEVTVESSSMDMSMLTGGQIVVEIKGRELDDIRDTAKSLGELLEGIEGTAEIDNGLGDPTNELRVVVDKEKAAGYNLTVAQVYMAVASKFSTATTVTTIYEEGTEYEIYVYDDRDTSVKKDDLTGIEIESADGMKVKVSDIASLEESTGFSSISRENSARVLKVTGSAAEGYNIGKINTSIEEALKDFQPVGDCTVALKGENESINEAFGDLFLMLALAVVFIYLVMVAQFQSLLSPFIVMFTIPLAFTGGFIGLFITGTPVSIVALIGLVVLVGVVVNNGIVYVTCVNQLREEEELSVHEALITAAKMRIRPIIMTSLTTIIGLLFSALDTSAGASMLRPVAITVIGGMLYATLLTLFFVPVIYSIFHRGKKEK